MYYELVILGRLMYGPYHGYLIMHVISEMIGPWQKVSAGTLYPLLARLEQDGLIVAHEEDARGHGRRTAKVFAITEAGRLRFRELMLDVASSGGEYQRVFSLKVPHMEFLARDERLQVVEHYRDYCRTALRHQERVTREMEGRRGGAAGEPDSVTAAGVANGILAGRQHVARWRMELAWAEQLAAQIAGEPGA